MESLENCPKCNAKVISGVAIPGSGPDDTDWECGSYFEPATNFQWHSEKCKMNEARLAAVWLFANTLDYPKRNAVALKEWPWLEE